MHETELASPVDNRVRLAGAAYNMGGIAVLVLLLAVGAAYLVDALGRDSQQALPGLEDAGTITQTLAGRELSIPRSWFRYGEQQREGFASQIDLVVSYAPEEGSSATPVNVSLLPRSRARTSAGLLDSVYLHQFGEETLGGVPGLIGKPMVDSDGFSGESIWYDALSPNPFVAKCLEGVDGKAAQCVRTVYLGSGIAAVYTFDATILGSWRLFDGEMERWLGRIGAL